jgi:type I restriction enzyme, R subunit
VHYPRPAPTFFRAIEATDHVTSQWLARDGSGTEYKPGDYLQAFDRFVRENQDHIDAVGILLDRPRAWSTAALDELRQKLRASPFRFTVETLQKACELHYHRALVDIISMVKHAADEGQPLLTAVERVDRAVAKLTAGKTFGADQEAWLERIAQHLRANLTIDRDDFDLPVFERAGGWAAARRAFPELETLLVDLNEAIAA